MLNTQLFQYQTEDVRKIRDFDGVTLLAWEMGLGKTYASLYYAFRYLPKDPPGPIVVVCPAHLKIMWQRQAQRHLNIRAEILSGEKVPPDKQPPWDKNQVLIVNHEILTPDHWKSRTTPPKNSWINWLAELKPRLLIGDESHLLSNPSSARTRGFRWLARRTPRCLLLTGTPLPNKPENLWSLLNILRPEEYSSRWEFCQQFSNAVRTPWGWSFKGAKCLDVLHARLANLMIRRRKADVLQDLPAITYSVVPIECDLREYRKAEADVVAFLSAQDLGAGQRAARAVELAKMNTLVQLAAQAKLEHVIRWVQSFLEESDGKLLLGAIHYKITDALMNAFSGIATLVDGTLSDKKKSLAFDKFNLDPHCRLLVGNIQAAGTGWSCTSSSTVAFAELPWKPGDVTQFSSRIHGIERGIPGTAAQVYFLVAAATIEERLCTAIQQKNGWASAAIDGDPSTADLDLASQVRRYLRSMGK